ncbi:MAG: hypothetical protein ACE5KF_07295 [Kiloniellaceae bacterium]
MTEIFVDGIRSIAVANGVARIELLQLKRDKTATKLEAQVVATMMIPVGALKDFTAQLESSLDKIRASLKGQAGGAAPASPGVDSALENL